MTRLSREPDGSWKLVDVGPEGEVVFAGVPLALARIYDRAESLPA